MFFFLFVVSKKLHFFFFFFLGMTFYDFINNWVWCLFKTCLAVYPLYVQWNDKRRYWNDTPLLMYITFHVIFCIGLTIWLGGLGLSFISYSYRDYTQMESSQKIISSADLLTCLHTFPSFSLSPFLLSSPPPSLPFNPSPPQKKNKEFSGSSLQMWPHGACSGPTGVIVA